LYQVERGERTFNKNIPAPSELQDAFAQGLTTGKWRKEAAAGQLGGENGQAQELFDALRLLSAAKA
jgi:hypothetical protein